MMPLGWELPFATHLLILFGVTFLANGLFPLFPITAYVIWLGGQFGHTSPWGIMPTLLIIGVAVFGNAAGWLVSDLYFLRARSEKLAAIEAKIPDVYRRLFVRHTAWSLFLFNAAPLPGDPMRLLASITGYPVQRGLMLISAGRVVRYALLVTVGATLIQYNALFWGVLIGFLLLPAFTSLFAWLKQTRGGTKPAAVTAVDAVALSPTVLAAETALEAALDRAYEDPDQPH